MTSSSLREGNDPAVRPQDDLFGHVNGGWYDTVEIPADLPGFGAFMQLRLDAEQQVGDLLRDASAASASGAAESGSPTQQIGDMFASFLDEERIEELGSRPIRADLAAVHAVSTTSELVGVLGALERVGAAGGVFTSYVNTDDRRSDRYLVNVAQGGLGLPDEAYYREEQFADIRAAYVGHVTKMLTLVGVADSHDSAQRVMALETRLASGHWDAVTCRDVIKAYTLMSEHELRAHAPEFDLSTWARGLGAPAGAFDEVIVRQPSYLGVVSEALSVVPLEDWKAWLTWQVVHSCAPFLDRAIVDENFDFYSRTLAGTESQRDRWKRGVAVVEAGLGEAIGEQFVARYFPAAAKEQMDLLVANLVEAYRRNIETLEWMSPQTRRKALDKLAVFRPKIGYPPRWRDYSPITIDRADLLGNVRRAAAFETDRQFGKLGGPVDRDEWLMYPQTVNAYYNPGTNEICFPAAILQPPFFDPEIDPACNYGGIGAVIGHEIGHGFDDQGAQYDGEGNLQDWWSEQDKAGFRERADRLIAQYDDLEPRALPGQKVNGGLTVGENIGDLGGLTIALKAYEISLDGTPAPEIDGLTGAQRAFFTWSLVWRGKHREALAQQLLTVDPHSPPDLRANIVRNLDEFHAAFETAPGDGLWLEPDERVRIW
ncbi:MAG: M13-type metalloendopeptidase [Nocardioidaceae bacterium]